MKKEKKKVISVTVTESCNLDCIYCYEDYKSKRCMTKELLVEIIDKELLSIPKNFLLQVEFMGGEPFMNFELIHDTVEYYKQTKQIKRLFFFATTNGTLIHGEIKEWLRENKDIFCCSLSLDGNKKMHDLNRSNSYDEIDIPFFYEIWPYQHVKMTISKESLPFLAEGVMFVHKMGFNLRANFAYGIDLSGEETIDLLQRELGKLIPFYLDNPAIKPFSLLNMPIHGIAYEEKRTKWCGVGTSMTVYDVEGRLRPCHFFENMTLGVKEILDNIDFNDVESITDEMCLNCPFIQICPTCYGSNYKATGDIKKRDINICRLTKVSIYATATFMVEKIKKYGIESFNYSTKKQQMLIDGIQKVYFHFHS